MLDVSIRLHKNHILFGKDELDWSEFESFDDENGPIRGFWGLKTWLIEQGLFVDEFSALLSIENVKQLYKVLSTNSLPIVVEYNRTEKINRLLNIIKNVM